ncbi:MAG: phosphatidylglycerophosphatase A family protein [bacterium]
MPSRSKSIPRLLATVLGAGYSPIAPGTAGSFVAALAFLFLPTYLPVVVFTTGLIALFGIAVWSAEAVAKAENRHDPSQVVIDEVVGMAVSVAFLPLTAATIAAGFVLFRIFDVTKPFPARRSERLPGGWGIVMDDVVAGIYSNLVLRVVMACTDWIR